VEQTKRAVLVVEDESIVAHDIQQTLLDLGFDAFAIASSADEAMARADERRPDVALVDIRIRGRLDGIKTAQLLEERFGVPIVYLTAHADAATLERAMKTHPMGYLLKPVKPAALRSTIEIALHHHEGPRPATPSTDAPQPSTRKLRSPTTQAVRRELKKVLGSADFDAPRRSLEFLRFVVEETLAGRGESISQTTIATKVFGRKDDFDAIVDPIVRIQAGRLRRSLERYYLLSGAQDPVRIQLPKGTYVPVFGGALVAEAGMVEVAATEAGSPERKPGRAEAAVGKPSGGWPSLVFTGFEATSQIPETQELAVQAGEELALELGRYWAVRVLRPLEGEAGTSLTDHARFALGGRLRQEGEGLRLSARLVDRTTGEQVWGEDYLSVARRGQWSGSPNDAARVIAARVGAEEGIVVQVLAAERRKGRPAVETSYDTILLSSEFFLTRDPKVFPLAVEALRRVVAAEPECGPAWSRLARLYMANYSFEATSISTPIDEGITFAQRAVRVDPTSRSARCVLASALLIKGELGAARKEVEEALRSSAGSLVYLEIIGYLLTLLGEWERGAALSRSARERNPHCLPHVLFGMWVDGLRQGNAEQAYQVALEYRDPTFFWRSVMRASCLGLLGRTLEAQSEVAEILSHKPDFAARGRILLGHYIKFDEVMNPIVDGLARAGLKVA
jgi:CheY-like chemotaxis protein